MNIAAIIVGIDGWEQYTEPLIKSLKQHEPESCVCAIVDNNSKDAYPLFADVGVNIVSCALKIRACYSAAINYGKELVDEYKGASWADWIIVLSNDVLCTAPFAHILEQYLDNVVVGPLMKDVVGFPYIEGWCVCIPGHVWNTGGGWDENFLGSDWEDVDFSTSAREHGFGLVEDTDLPFVHLDQRQRYYIVDDFAGKNAHNQSYFMQKHAQVTA